MMATVMFVIGLLAPARSASLASGSMRHHSNVLLVKVTRAWSVRGQQHAVCVMSVAPYSAVVSASVKLGISGTMIPSKKTPVCVVMTILMSRGCVLAATVSFKVAELAEKKLNKTTTNHSCT